MNPTRKFILIASTLIFIVVDLLFIPFYVLGRIFELLSQALYGMNDEPGMCLTKTWIKKITPLCSDRR